MSQIQQDIYFSDSDLILHCKKKGCQLPFSLSSLRKDRLDGRLSGVPYRKVGGAIIYCPREVFEHLAGLPIIQQKRHPALQAKPAGRRGKPKKTESVAAQRAGFSSVKEYRISQQGSEK